MKVLFLALWVVACGGCQSEDFERWHSRDGYSIRALEGYTPRRDHGSIVFFPDADGDKASIAIRAVPRRGRAHAETVDATARVLGGYRDATVSAPEPIEDDRYPATAFSVAFSPPSTSARYERRHVVVTAKDHVFHLLATAPAGSLGETPALLSSVTASLKEEAR